MTRAPNNIRIKAYRADWPTVRELVAEDCFGDLQTEVPNEEQAGRIKDGIPVEMSYNVLIERVEFFQRIQAQALASKKILHYTQYAK